MEARPHVSSRRRRADALRFLFKSGADAIGAEMVARTT